MLSLASNAMLHSAERLKIGGISVRRSSSPKFRLKIETNLDADGNCEVLDVKTQESGGLWNDQVVTSKRIPREEVQLGYIIARGSFGQVYSGLFRGEKVAVKTLLPEEKEENVNNFLNEVKIAATLNHPHIIRFIGVSWTSVSDLCVVQEFMEGGDLRSLLDRYEADRRSIGFDREKTKIAMQICSALAYMHSLSPPVIHSSLKSRNVLLNGKMEAKISNFGTSPKRTYKASTECKSVTLWTAPEIIRGEMHSADADIFSFGIILSELDMLSAPYAQARQHLRDSSCRPLLDADILQKVTKGSLRVVFSESGPTALAELGRACVSVNPLKRPTAPEVLYRLQTILSEEQV
ncbi:putative serine/threonine-protein kinase drkB [Phytophthora citrophthora]|uniref:Serine/threonine-protein kinase drkB n=1 Tax=Phytophthora citrophthora TaxID=4793 RepID=A0AAD9G439_9STRA|nr:putative serine/threonine-protein kinase drkB [Phytophthora citrophthora]